MSPLLVVLWWASVAGALIAYYLMNNGDPDKQNGGPGKDPRRRYSNISQRQVYRSGTTSARLRAGVDGLGALARV